MKIISILLLSVSLLFSMQSRVINGTQVDSSNTKYRAIAGLLENNKFICGATVISPTWVLTAAHCVSSASGRVTNASSLSILVNTYNNADGSGDKVSVERVIVHPDYNNDSSDIALIELSSSVENYISINTKDDLSTNDITYVAGWGNTLIDGYNFPSDLREAAVPVINLDTCNAAYSYNNTLFDSQLCVGYMNGDNIKDSCQGDSGGPLLSEQDGQWVLSGIVSYGGSDTQACAAENFPGIYTKVSSFSPWIAEYVTEPVVDTSTLSGYIDSLSFNEWHLVGTSEVVNVSSLSSVKIVLIHSSNAYKAYSPDSAIKDQLVRQGYEIIDSIPAHSGMWIKK